MKDKLRILENVLGKAQYAGEEYLFTCPKCQHHKKKLSLNISKDVWKCWVCEYSGFKLRRLVRKWGSFVDKKQWTDVDESLDLGNFESTFREYFEGPGKQQEQKLSLPPEFKTLATETVTRDSLKARGYLKSRGVSRKDILQWKIGYCSSGDYEKRIIVPSFGLTGHINYFVGRAYDGSWRSYKNPVADKDIIFNSLYVDWTKDLVIVEGVFDAIVTGNAVPILGSTLRNNSKLFQAIVLHDTPVYIGLDSDAEQKALRLIEALLQYDIELYKIDTSGYKDIGSMSRETFLERKKKAILMTPQTFFQYRIQLMS